MATPRETITSALASLIKSSKFIQAGLFAIMIAIALSILASDQVKLFGIVLKSCDEAKSDSTPVAAPMSISDSTGGQE